MHYPPAPITEPAAAFEVRMRTRVSEWINDAVLDPMRGELQATVRDCAGRVASGVSVTGANDPSVEVGYDSLRYVDRIHRDRTSTGPGGRAGVLNHPTGSQTFTFRRSDGTVVATRQVLIRANMTTMVDVSPTP